MTAVQEFGDAVKAMEAARPGDACRLSVKITDKDLHDRRSLDDRKEGVTSEGRKHETGDGQRLRTSAMITKERWQLFSLCFTLFLAGWDGGTQGPLIPRLQIFYDLNYLVVSMIFVLGCIGFLVGAFINIRLTDKLGMGKILVLGSVAQSIAYAMISPATPFAVVCVAFFIDGFGVSLQDGQANSYVASLTRNPEFKMGLLHALYGLGAMCSPLVATPFSQMERRWSFHFLTSLGLAVVNLIIIIIVFKFKNADDSLEDIGEQPRDKDPGESGKFGQIIRRRNVHLLAFWALAYCGLEFAIGGWTVSYLQTHRNGGPSTGFVSTGFVGGLALGRVVLLGINKMVGDHLVVFIYTALALGLDLIVWLVPSFIGDAVAVSFVGFFLGPMYPILMNETGRLVPHWILTGSIGWVSSFGTSGSALFPFLTGAFSERFGIVSLQPLSISLLASLVGLWLLIPNGQNLQRRST